MCDTHVGGVKQPKPSLLQLHQQTGKPNKRGMQIAEGNGTKIKHTTHKPLFQTVLQNLFSLLCYKEHDSFVPPQHK